MIVREASRFDEERWDAYVEAHPGGLGYHLFAWGKAVEAAYGHAAHYLLAEKDGHICGILPLIAFKSHLRSLRLVSLPYCDVGGVLADREEIVTALLDRARQVAGRLYATDVEIRSSAGEVQRGDKAHKVRLLLDLPKNSEQLLAGFKAKLRSQVKKPLRDGLVAILGGLDLVDPFYQIFSENMHQLGSPVHSRAWFQAILSSFGDGARVCLVRTPDGKEAAAALVLFCGGTVSVPWASSLRRFNHMNSNMLLYWTLLAHAADNGFRQFDFGRSTPGSGTCRFKEQWGARPFEITWTSLKNAGQPASVGTGHPRLRELAETMWRKLPLTLCNRFGPVVRRQISL